MFKGRSLRSWSNASHASRQACKPPVHDPRFSGSFWFSTNRNGAQKAVYVTDRARALFPSSLTPFFSRRCFRDSNESPEILRFRDDTATFMLIRLMIFLFLRRESVLTGVSIDFPQIIEKFNCVKIEDILDTLPVTKLLIFWRDGWQRNWKPLHTSRKFEQACTM